MAAYRITFGRSATLDNRDGNGIVVFSWVYFAGLVASARAVTLGSVAPRCGVKAPKLGSKSVFWCRGDLRSIALV